MKIILLLLMGLILANVHFAEAQQPKLTKIGWLAEQLGSGREIFRREFRELGYVEGKNIAYEYRYGGNDLGRLSALADELVSLEVDVIIVNGTMPAVVSKNATRITPIVLLNVADPVGAGLIDSLPRPGGNVTGVTSIAAVLAGKRLELLKESILKLSAGCDTLGPTGLIWHATMERKPTCGATNWACTSIRSTLPRADKYETAFKETIKAGNAALKVTSSPALTADQKLITELAIKNRLPAINARADYVTGVCRTGKIVEPYRRAA